MKILDNMQSKLKRDIASSVCHVDNIYLSKMLCQMLNLVTHFPLKLAQLYANVLLKCSSV